MPVYKDLYLRRVLENKKRKEVYKRMSTLYVKCCSLLENCYEELEREEAAKIADFSVFLSTVLNGSRKYDVS